MSQYPGSWGEGRKNPVVIWSHLSWWLWLLGDASSGAQGTWWPRRWPRKVAKCSQSLCKRGATALLPLCSVWGMGRVGERVVFAGRGWCVLMSRCHEGPQCWRGQAQPLKWQMLICESRVCGTCFCNCAHCSQVMVLISPKLTPNCSSSVYCNNFFHQITFAFTKGKNISTRLCISGKIL